MCFVNQPKSVFLPPLPQKQEVKDPVEGDPRYLAPELLEVIYCNLYIKKEFNNELTNLYKPRLILVIETCFILILKILKNT